MNLTKLIQTHVDNHVQRFRHLDAHTKNIVKEIALPHIELHHLYANHPQDSSFEPAEPLFDLLKKFKETVAETVAPLPQNIKENDKLRVIGVDMDEILAREDADIAQVPLHLYFKADQLAAMSEEKKQQMRVHYYENHWRQQISSKMLTNLRNIGSDLIKEPQVRFAAELKVFKQKLEKFVQLQHGKVQRLFEEGAISGRELSALLKTITVQNIVQDSIEQEKAKQFGAAEAELGRLVDEDEGVFIVPHFTGAQTSDALNNIATTMMQTTGVAWDVAFARARKMMRTTLNVGSLASTFVSLGGTAAIGSAAGLLICNSIQAEVDQYYYTLIGLSTGAGMSIGVLYSLYTICAVEPPNVGGVISFIDEGLNQMSDFMGTLDEYDVAQEEKEQNIEGDMFDAIGEEHADAQAAAGPGMTEDELDGARDWVNKWMAQHENIRNLDDISSPDYTFQVRVGDKLLSLGTARARRDELFNKIGDFYGMSIHTFVSVNGETKVYYVYEPLPTKKCIFTRLTMGKLISFVESLSPDDKDFVFREFHLTIPLNYTMGERLSRLVSPEENAFMKREDRGVYYPANCVFNIIEQAESVEMLKGHKDNRDFESLLKKPEGSLLFRLFSGLVHYLKQTFSLGIGVVKIICETIWTGLKMVTTPAGNMFTGIVRQWFTDDIANIVDHLFLKVGGGIEDLLSHPYRHVLTIVDYVASKQTYLLIGNTICCIAAQTVVLTSVGFLFPAAGVPVTSSYIFWKGVKLASQMMGMQIADAILTLLGSTGRWFDQICGDNSWLAFFISKAVPDSMASWIKSMINISTNLKTMIAPVSTNAMNIATRRTAGGAAIVFAAGVAYFAALPFAIPIGLVGAAGGLHGMFNMQVAATNHFPEAFKTSAHFFHQQAKNMLYALITSPYKGFRSLFKSGANITFMQLQQPILMSDMLCQIFSSGFLGRNCRKVQKMFTKFWRRLFAARFIYGMIMDIAVLSGTDGIVLDIAVRSGITNSSDAWSQGHCSAHLARIPINDYKKVKNYKWRTKHNQIIKFVVEETKTTNKHPKIVQIIIDNVSHDVTVPPKSDKWVIHTKPTFKYDENKNIVLTGGNAVEGSLGLEIGDEMEKLLKYINNDSETGQTEQGPIETTEGAILMRDIPLQFELAQLTTQVQENYIVVDANGVTIAICQYGELRTAPISAYDTTEEASKTSKEALQKLKSWKLDRTEFENGTLKIKTEKLDGFEYASGYYPSTGKEKETHIHGHKKNSVEISDKKGKAFQFDISTTQKALSVGDVPYKAGVDIKNEQYRVLYVPEGNVLLDGRPLQWEDSGVKHNDADMYANMDKFVQTSLVENMDTIGDVLKERWESSRGLFSGEHVPGPRQKILEKKAAEAAEAKRIALEKEDAVKRAKKQLKQLRGQKGSTVQVAKQALTDARKELKQHKKDAKLSAAASKEKKKKTTNLASFVVFAGESLDSNK